MTFKVLASEILAVQSLEEVMKVARFLVNWRSVMDFWCVRCSFRRSPVYAENR